MAIVMIEFMGIIVIYILQDPHQLHHLQEDIQGIILVKVFQIHFLKKTNIIIQIQLITLIYQLTLMIIIVEEEIENIQKH